ncbi:AraC family transcriptional regulator [Kiloniella laminariae]|uniref:AraC family transcriptional regulator n=1 Tax=Kiloniella laminariae TaxID=454162 RepID=A0ABT4LF38_9PROT|nr:AraC family transcriptional regulator [Kiloniella laminariae]MCZ4279715.1 AraC family transcriptional regulator [Kiloniella laminariae]
MTEERPDRLSALIKRFRVHARVFPLARSREGLLSAAHASFNLPEGTRDISRGAFPAVNRGDEPAHSSRANFYIARRGQMALSDPRLTDLEDKVPLLVYFPRGVPAGTDCLQPAAEHGAGGRDHVSALIDTGGEANPIALALPDLVIVRLDQAKALQAVTDILLEEATAPRCGGSAVIDRLCEIVVIRLLRHLIEAGETQVGLLAGLAHPNLSLAVIAIHENPDHSFCLEELAAIAAMSRTHFANSFRNCLGVTPGQYISSWRLTLARMELGKGTPLKVIAQRVGFSSSAALSRAYSRHYGVSPRQEQVQSA